MFVASIYPGVDLLLFFSLILGFDEDSFTFFLLEYFYVQVYTKLEFLELDDEELSEIKEKSNLFMGNLRDILKYPKFSNIELVALNIEDLKLYLFRSLQDLRKINLEIHIFLENRIIKRSFEYDYFEPVQHLIEDLQRLPDLKTTEHKAIVEQYDLFIAFDHDDESSDIALAFDLQ